MRFPGAIVMLICAAFGLSAVSPLAALADGQFPYTAYVNSDDVYIRSGPGKNYYPTEKLPKGEPVEVYRHDPGGWLAIRPPQGSFSWVPADALQPKGDRLAVVEKDRAKCFVGTRFSNARDVHQVQLNQGEHVEILDIKQVGEEPNVQTWCQISPPSGEFRWVFGKFVDRRPPSGLSAPRGDDDLPKSHEVFDERDRRRDWSDAKDRTQEARSSTENRSAEVQATATERPATGRPRASGWRSADEKPATEALAAGDSADPFQAELNAIDLEISKMVADDPSSWELTGLRRRAENSLGRAHTALERGKVRLILNRVARFEDVKRRHDMLSQPGAIASTRQSVLPVDSPGRYDGIGKLTTVVSQRPNAPRFALIDESNRILSFVTPAPGVNLQPYLGKEVGVTGQKGFMPELQTPHVTAMRISTLEAPTTVR